MQYKWILRRHNSGAEEVDDQRLQPRHLSPVVIRLLADRGIVGEDAIAKFFRPQLSELHDPFLMKDMDLAVKRLNKAVGRKEKIFIYGDYDVDGTTAVALVYKSLRAMGCSENQLDYYIPDRYDEGYGVTRRGIEYIHKREGRLIIALDCGIKANECVLEAKDLGIDFIICDHHTPGDTLPEAVAVLDAKRKDNTYPYEHLSGCGVGFKLMQAFAINNDYPVSNLYRYLDLLAVSIASDIVPVMGENRILAYHGLKRLNRSPSMGLDTIIRASGLSGKEIGMSDIIFKIGPRINASGRMMNGRESVNMLLVQDREMANRYNDSINTYNDHRRELDTSTTKDAIQLLEKNPEMLEDKIIILYEPSWHKGIIGIVASRISERYNKPTIIMTSSGNYVSGSARSAGGFDIYHAIEVQQDRLVNFGGHMYAAGLTIEEGEVAEFILDITRYANEHIQEEKLEPHINIDMEIPLKEVTSKLLRDLKKMSPFGPDNTKPLFVSRDLCDTGDSRIVGRGMEHLKLDLTDKTRQLTPINAIAFNQAKHIALVKSEAFAACYTIEENSYRGTNSLQLLVSEIIPLQELPF